MTADTHRARLEIPQSDVAERRHFVCPELADYIEQLATTFAQDPDAHGTEHGSDMVDATLRFTFTPVD